MAKSMEQSSKFSESGMDGAFNAWGEWSKSWQALTVEMGDFTKRSFEDSTQTMEKLMTARNFEQALEIQSSFVKRWCDDYMQQMTRIGAIYTDVAKQAELPHNRMVAGRR